MNKPIRITARQATEWGFHTTEMAKDLIRQVVEEQRGAPYQWLHEINIDAIVLVAVPHVAEDIT